jgi:hypothetical protein
LRAAQRGREEDTKGKSRHEGEIPTRRGNPDTKGKFPGGRLGLPSRRRREETSSALAWITSDRRGLRRGRWCGASPGGVVLHSFFGIVNQVLVRLWARRWREVRANGRSPLATAQQCSVVGIAKSDRPRSCRVATPRGYSLAIDGTCDQRRLADCRL